MTQYESVRVRLQLPQGNFDRGFPLVRTIKGVVCLRLSVTKIKPKLRYQLQMNSSKNVKYKMFCPAREKNTYLIPSVNILFKTSSTGSKLFRANSIFPLGPGTSDTWAMSPATANNKFFLMGPLKYSLRLLPGKRLAN